MPKSMMGAFVLTESRPLGLLGQQLQYFWNQRFSHGSIFIRWGVTESSTGWEADKWPQVVVHCEAPEGNCCFQIAFVNWEEVRIERDFDLILVHVGEEGVSLKIELRMGRFTCQAPQENFIHTDQLWQELMEFLELQLAGTNFYFRSSGVHGMGLQVG
jgi:hypothetical protein